MPNFSSLAQKTLTAAGVKPYRFVSRLHTINNPNAYSTSSGDTFGHSVAMDGNYAIVGAIGEDDAGGLTSGKAYIFHTSTGGWSDATLAHTLDNPNAYDTSTSDNFGRSVAISGNYCIVGTYQEDDSGGTNSGKAYIFNVTTGALVHTLDNPNAYSTSANDRFGSSVAISGNYCIVGAPWEDDASGSSVGNAYVFDVTTGLLVYTLNNPSTFGPSGDEFGNAVAISDTYVVVGAQGAVLSASGQAYVFDVTTGALLHTLVNPAPGNSDNFGNALAISGNYAVVAAYRDGATQGTDSGTVYIFNLTTGTLVSTIANPNLYGGVTGYQDYFGNAVAISGNYCIVGAYSEDESTISIVQGGSEGKAYVFVTTTGDWTDTLLVNAIDAPDFQDPNQNDFFGNAVAISGDYAIVGAYFDDVGGSSSGTVHIFKIAV